MNPYTEAPVALQLFVSEPFHDTIAVINLAVFGTAPNQVFALADRRIKRIRSLALNQPVDLAPAEIETESTSWASNTTLEQGADFYVANRGDNTIVRMRQNGTVVAIRRVSVHHNWLGDARLNGIATSSATFTGPDEDRGGVLQLPAFGD
jgi:serine/threonine protein phosphatase PrpC